MPVDHLLKKKKKKKFIETENSRYIFQNKLDKACFQHDMAYGDFKNLTRRTASNKALRDKAFNIAKNLKYDGKKEVLFHWFTIFLIKSLLVLILELLLMLSKGKLCQIHN